MIKLLQMAAGGVVALLAALFVLGLIAGLVLGVVVHDRGLVFGCGIPIIAFLLIYRTVDRRMEP